MPSRFSASLVKVTVARSASLTGADTLDGGSGLDAVAVGAAGLLGGAHPGKPRAASARVPVLRYTQVIRRAPGVHFRSNIPVHQQRAMVNSLVNRFRAKLGGF